jgi:hypothetical protein
MTHSVIPRLSAFLLMLFFAALFGGLLSPDLAAQKTKPKKEEEEEPARPKLKPPLRIDEPDAREKEARRTDLAAEAEQADQHPAVRDLYRRLALEHDEVLFPVPRPTLPVQLIPQYIGLKPVFDGKITLKHLDAKGAPTKDEEVTRKSITGVDHYETLAISQVDRFLEKVKDDPKMPRPDALLHAQKVLQIVVEFHDSARESGKRKGPGWATLEQSLRTKLRDVRLERLSALADLKRWDDVRTLAGQLGAIDEYKRDEKVTSVLVKIRALEIGRGIDEDNLESFVTARKLLEELERQFPEARNHEAVQRLRERLQEKAASALRRARDLAKKDPKTASSQLRTVENIWPQLPGVQDLRQELRPYKALGVGVRQLPRYLTPATAATDSERQGMELIFESLLRPVGDPITGQRYEPVLSDGPPRLVPMGRQFQMVNDARWYRAGRGSENAIDEEVTAADVRGTISLYQKWAGKSPDWGVLGEPYVDDPYRLRLTLNQGYLDPLSLMTFKVLPAKYLKDADDRTFAQEPIGSGPYQYLGVKKGNRGDYAQFLANPTYGRRAGKQELPRMPAIHFYETRVHLPAAADLRERDLATEFKSGDMQLLLDLPTTRIKLLENDANGLRGVVKVHTLRSRRVWFLAVNHRDKRLQSDELRKAIAHAIDREKILNDWFRDGYHDDSGKPVHRVLNGPYPAGSWACDPGLPADPYKPALAKTMTAGQEGKRSGADPGVPQRRAGRGGCLRGHSAHGEGSRPDDQAAGHAAVGAASGGGARPQVRASLFLLGPSQRRLLARPAVRQFRCREGRTEFPWPAARFGA